MNDDDDQDDMGSPILGLLGIAGILIWVGIMAMVTSQFRSF